MSKTTVPCSSCPAAAAEKVVTPKDNKIIFVLEDFSPTNSDTIVKVKKFKKFLDYDLKTLHITGHLQKYVHINGLIHIRMVVNYQDKTTSKFNHLSLEFLTKINEENKNTVGVDGSSKCNFPSNCWLYTFIDCTCLATSTGAVTIATDTNRPARKSSELLTQGVQAKMKFFSAKKCTVTLFSNY